MESGDKREIGQQIALMNSFAVMTHKCFLKCVSKPGRSLSHTEETCATNCVDRNRDAQLFMFSRLQEKAELERSKSGLASH